jgi:type II secretory pathway pseudopilin PulG
MTPKTRRSDDSGAALVLALVFITVVAVVVAVVLSFADTSMRTTMALRDQAEATANAEGVAQIAINTLRQGTYPVTGNCFGAGAGDATLTLPPNYYAPASGAADPARVTCEQDTTNSVAGGSTVPDNAILTLGTSTSEEGIYVDVNGNGNLKVTGNVSSNSTIKVDHGGLTASGSARTRKSCSGSIVSTPSKACNTEIQVGDPGYSAPTATPTPQSVQQCNDSKKHIFTFNPGLYTNANDLNKLNDCKNSTFWFTPGTYYFNFRGGDGEEHSDHGDGDTEWAIDTGYLIAGTLTPGTTLSLSSPPTIPGACVSPVPPSSGGAWTAPVGVPGVQFVFGGQSRINFGAAQAEICGTYSASAPPIALYGLKTDVGTGSNKVSAQNGCITDLDHGCSVISSDSSNSKLVIQGTTYVPLANVDITIKNSSLQTFRGGVIARSLDVSATGSANLASPAFVVPAGSITAGRTIVWLNVYVCPGVSTCNTGGTLRLRAKVGIADSNGIAVPGTRQITVYSWSVQR